MCAHMCAYMCASFRNLTSFRDQKLDLAKFFSLSDGVTMNRKENKLSH